MNPAYLIAGIGSVLFGASDLSGGIGARRSPAVTVTLFAGLPALLVLAVGALMLPGHATPTALAWGAAGGACGGVGALLLYRAFAIGPISIASPVVCVTGLVIPVIVGLALGERPGQLAIAGLVLAPLSIVLLSQPESHLNAEERRHARRVIAPSLVAGGVVGLFLLFIGRVPAGSGLVPLVLARVVGMVALAIWALVRRAPFVPSRGAMLATLGAGVFDSTANIAYMVAVQKGTLSLVAALVSLSPATSVLLARMFLGERWSGVQRLGFFAALVSGAMISLG